MSTHIHPALTNVKSLQISDHEVFLRDKRQAEFDQQLTALLALIREKAVAQHNYNEATNIPKGISSPAETVANAIRSGVAHGWNSLHSFDPAAALYLAHDILEDANCHPEAAAIWPSVEAENQPVKGN